MKIELYRNIHKSRKEKCIVYSMRDAKTKKVIGHTKGGIYLKDCKLVVGKSGRARVHAEQRKNVHAVIRGTLIPRQRGLHIYQGIITYNPYKYETFVNKKTEESITESPMIYVDKIGKILYK